MKCCTSVFADFCLWVCVSCVSSNNGGIPFSHIIDYGIFTKVHLVVFILYCLLIYLKSI